MLPIQSMGSLDMFEMILTSGSIAGDAEGIASVKEMLLGSDGNQAAIPDYWLSGKLATSIVVADHGSPSPRGQKAPRDINGFRPIFHATFWPAINVIKVRFIGEVANSEYFQDQRYALTLQIRGKEVYKQKPIMHSAGSRWTIKQ